MVYTIKKHIYEVLELVEKATKKEDKISILKSNESWALKGCTSCNL
jgi:hypothetical protein